VDLTLRGIFRDKSNLQTGTGSLATEPDNSHGNEWIGDLVFRYFPDDRTAFKTWFQGRYFTENDYPSDSNRFIGQREKFSFGVGATRVLMPHIEIGLDAKGFIKDDAETHSPIFRNARNFTGVSVALMLVGTY
jgi:hypothetical protein